ncbi:hypothetical protein KFE80_12885 [bacterium SCSIO 12696]|nr:hypothetical protein KFE80_12885 [bacterium SCSIO 12696]
MRYCIQKFALGKHPEIELSENEFQKLQSAREKLSASLGISEKFELMLQNFIELEKELLINSADLIVSPFGDYPQVFDSRLTLNRRIVNLLTSTKLYVDQATKHIRPFFEDESEVKKEVKSYFSEEYDNSEHYRFMEALRNYVQHDGLAVHNLSYPFRWVGEGPNKLMEHRTEIFSRKNLLEEDKNFKRAVLSEMDEKVDINVSAREYVGCLKRIHLKLQNLIDNQTAQARELFQNYISEYERVNDQQVIGLYALAKERGEPIDKIVDKFSIQLDWDDIRVKLNNKHRSLGKIEKMFVSGALVTSKSR